MFVWDCPSVTKLGCTELHQRDASFSHTWISVIFHVTFINGHHTPVILGESSPFHACCTPSSPCACCHTACERDPAVWSPCGSCTLGKGGWDGSCMLNKRSLKATRYLHLPSGCDTASEVLWLPSEQLRGAQGKLFRSFRSGHGVRICPRVWE